MGKGTIVSDLGEGQYSVTKNPDNSCINSEIARLQAKVTPLENDITAAETAHATLVAAAAAAAAALDVAIAAYIAGTGTQEQVAAAEKVANEAALAVRFDADKLANLKLQLAALNTEIARLQGIRLPDETVSAWCADKTEELSGEVGLIEINNNPTAASVLIQPGFGGNAAYSYARDGVVVSPEAVGQATNFLFWALWPCYSKFKPGYRVGVITDTDEEADTADVTLDEATGDQSILLDITRSLTNVPVDYMTCNAKAFEVGDRVVIEFAGDPVSPTVIGFESEPKGCGLWDLNGSVRQSVSAEGDILAIDVYGIYADLGDRVYNNPENFTVTLNGTSVPYLRTDGTETDYAVHYYLFQETTYPLYKYWGIAVIKDPDRCCNGDVVVYVYVGESRYQGTLGSLVDVVFQENGAPVIDCTIQSYEGSVPSVGVNQLACEVSGYDGSEVWVFTKRNGTNINNRNDSWYISVA